MNAQQTIKDLKEKGFDAQAILYASEDGDFLGKAGWSQELAEEVHELCEKELEAL